MLRQIAFNVRQFTYKGQTFTQSTLGLCGVQLGHSGGYICVVESGDTTASLTTQLTVRNKTGTSCITY